MDHRHGREKHRKHDYYRQTDSPRQGPFCSFAAAAYASASTTPPPSTVCHLLCPVRPVSSPVHMMRNVGLVAGQSRTGSRRNDHDMKGNGDGRLLKNHAVKFDQQLTVACVVRLVVARRRRCTTGLGNRRIFARPCFFCLRQRLRLRASLLLARTCLFRHPFRGRFFPCGSFRHSRPPRVHPCASSADPERTSAAASATNNAPATFSASTNKITTRHTTKHTTGTIDGDSSKSTIDAVADKT